MAQSADKQLRPGYCAYCESQIIYASKVSELRLVYARHLDLAQKLSSEIIVLMQQNVLKNAQKLVAATDDKVKSDLTARIQHENQLAADFKTMSARPEEKWYGYDHKGKSFYSRLLTAPGYTILKHWFQSPEAMLFFNDFQRDQ